MLALGDGVDRSKLLGSETHCDDLHRLSTPPRTTTAAALHLLNVVPGLSLLSPLADLLLAHHDQNRMTKR